MKNITITLDEKTARWARIYAAEHNTSISRIVGEMLARQMRELSEYDRAMRAFLAKRPVKLGKPGHGYPAREALHERSRIC